MRSLFGTAFPSSVHRYRHACALAPARAGILIVALLGGIALNPPAAGATSYTFTFFSTPGALQTTASGVNDSGQIVGYFTADGSTYQGFLDNGGSFTTISVPGAADTWANGINSNGDIVGTAFFAASPLAYQGFLDNHGSFTLIDVPGYGPGLAYGINNNGEIVGTVGTAGFLDDGGTFSLLIPPETTIGGSHAYGINNDGDIVGSYTNALCDCGLGFLYNGIFTNLPLAGTGGAPTKGSPSGINDSGDIVGGFDGNNFLYSNGTVTPFGTVYTQPYDINDNGDIVGVSGCGAQGDDFQGNVSCGFLATPAAATVPEPSSAALLAPILLGLLALRRRKAA